ncbi:MAG TPA: hypothetical protein VGO93_27460 [Candidatus Xenobia bacterium]|jgi:hypothetical protein
MQGYTGVFDTSSASTALTAKVISLTAGLTPGLVPDAAATIGASAQPFSIALPGGSSSGTANATFTTPAGTTANPTGTGVNVNEGNSGP